MKHAEMLQRTAGRMVATDKGLLAADESNRTIGKRLGSVGRARCSSEARCGRYTDELERAGAAA